MTHLGISWTISAIGLKLYRLSHQLLSKKTGKIDQHFFCWCHHSFFALCCLFSAGLIKRLTGRRCTSEIGQKRLKELKYNSENFKVVADTENPKKPKVEVVYSLPYGMGLNTIVSRLQIFSRKIATNNK